MRAVFVCWRGSAAGGPGSLACPRTFMGARYQGVGDVSTSMLTVAAVLGPQAVHQDVDCGGSARTPGYAQRLKHTVLRRLGY